MPPWARLGLEENKSSIFFQHSLRKLINIITAHHWQFFPSGFDQTCEDYQKTEMLVCVNRKPLKLAVW